MLGGRLGLASLYSWVGWEGGQGGPISVVREGMWGIARLRFFIRGEYSALGCVEGVGWGEGGGVHSVSVLGVVASLLSSFGSCDSVEYTSGAGVAHLGFCIRGEYSILGCDDDVEWGQLQLGRVHVWRFDEDGRVLDDGGAGGVGEGVDCTAAVGGVDCTADVGGVDCTADVGGVEGVLEGEDLLEDLFEVDRCGI